MPGISKPPHLFNPGDIFDLLPPRKSKWLFIFTIIIPNDQVEERRRRERENMAGLREALGSQNRNSDNIDVEVRKIILWR